jgi:hypothetical protein
MPVSNGKRDARDNPLQRRGLLKECAQRSPSERGFTPSALGKPGGLTGLDARRRHGRAGNRAG